MVNNTPPVQEQLPVLRQAVASKLHSGVIEETTRGPFLNPIQILPKNDKESRFILNCSALTPHLQAPKFQLPPLPVALQVNPLPKNPFYTKLDLAEAYYHFGLNESTRCLTTFRLDGRYYRFTVLPFGVRPAPFMMQMLANALTCYPRDQGVWAWSHLNNFLLAHPDTHHLTKITNLFVDVLTSKRDS